MSLTHSLTARVNVIHIISNCYYRALGQRLWNKYSIGPPTKDYCFSNGLPIAENLSIVFLDVRSFYNPFSLTHCGPSFFRSCEVLHFPVLHFPSPSLGLEFSDPAFSAPLIRTFCGFSSYRLTFQTSFNRCLTVTQTATQVGLTVAHHENVGYDRWRYVTVSAAVTWAGSARENHNLITRPYVATRDCPLVSAGLSADPSSAYHLKAAVETYKSRLASVEKWVKI